MYVGIFVFDTIRVHISMQEPSQLGKIVLASIWFTMLLIQIMTRVSKDFLTLTHPLNTNIWLVLQFDTHEHVLQYIPLLMFISDCMH